MTSWCGKKSLHSLRMAGLPVPMSITTQSDTWDFASPDDFDGVEVILEQL